GLGESGVPGLITEAQFPEAADVVLAGLAAQGLADAEARDLLGPALTPTALDLLAVLAEPYPPGIRAGTAASRALPSRAGWPDRRRYGGVPTTSSSRGRWAPRTWPRS